MIYETRTASVVLNPRLRQIIRRALKRDKWSWLFVTAAGPVTPLIETTVIACLYLVIAPDSLAGVRQTMAGLDWIPASAREFASTHLLMIIFGLSIVLLAVQVVLKYSVDVKGQVLRYRMEINDASTLTSSYLNTPPQTAHRIGKDRVIASLLQDSGSIGALCKLAVDSLGALWAIGIYLAAALWVSPIVVAVAAAIFTIPLWLSRRIVPQMQAVGERKVLAQEDSLGFFTDIFQGFDRSKLDGLEQDLMDRSTTVIHHNFGWRIEKRKLQARFARLTDGLAMAGLLITLFAGTAMFDVPLPQLIALFVVFTRLKSAVSSISGNLLDYKELVPSIGRMLSLLDELTAKPVAYRRTEAAGKLPLRSIEMRNVSFAYEPAGQPVLCNVDFVAKAGDRILISGPSGEGKSTFLKVVSGLLPPSSGEVRCDSAILDDALFYVLREKMICVSPTVYVFRDTLRANLTMGTDVSEAQLAAAIRHAGLTDVVAGLPNGLDTNIGADADQLSLGQRQRVILARIYLKQPKLILLDEATANLDPDLEIELIDRLQSFADASSIIIMIAHKAPPNFRYNRRQTFAGGRLRDEALPDAVAASGDRLLALKVGDGQRSPAVEGSLSGS